MIVRSMITEKSWWIRDTLLVINEEKTKKKKVKLQHYKDGTVLRFEKRKQNQSLDINLYKSIHLFFW